MRLRHLPMLVGASVSGLAQTVAIVQPGTPGLELIGSQSPSFNRRYRR